jgi:predicted Zn-dependent protease
MPTAGFRTCASCGTRNKPNWEFCVRCGEPLEAAAPALDFEDDTAAAEPTPVDTDRSGFPWRSVLTLVGAVALIVLSVTMKPMNERTSPLLGFMSRGAASPVPAPAQVQSAMSRQLFEGRTLLVAGRPEAALGPLAQAAGEDPGNPEAQAVYGRALWASGAREDAIRSFEAASRLGGGAYRTEYANALTLLGRTAEARLVLERAVAERPNDAKALAALGQVLNAEEKPTEALAVLTRAAALTPDDPRLLANLGHALERSGNPARAAEVLAGVVERQPESTVARGLLAEAYFKQGRPDEAVAVVRDGLQKRPESSLLYRSLGALLERTGKAAEAAAAYREYLRLAPGAGDAQALAERAAQLERAAAPPAGT